MVRVRVSVGVVDEPTRVSHNASSYADEGQGQGQGGGWGDS